MTDNNAIRSGSLQFYPRVRSKKPLPNVNWKPISKSGIGLMGFIGYKVGMISAFVKDDTEHSLTKGRRIIVPATIVECPPMKIYSVRFYKNSKVLKDFVVSDEKVLKRNVKVPKNKKGLEEVEGFDDIRVVVYSGVWKTAIGKKKPDFLEIGVSGSLDEKLNFVKEKIGKEIFVMEVLNEGVVDVRGVTKGFGNQGPMKRFGISLKSHKSEKGRRRPGSLAPWHPSRVTFRAPQAGQMGYHNRVNYNNLILEVGKISEKDVNKKGGFEHYGKIKNDYLLLRGSVPGPKKRGLVITPSIRPTKRISKKKLEVLELR